MKRRIIQYTTVVLAFLAGMIFMTYMTRMGNRDMTGDMAQAQLPDTWHRRKSWGCRCWG